MDFATIRNFASKSNLGYETRNISQRELSGRSIRAMDVVDTANGDSSEDLRSGPSAESKQEDGHQVQRTTMLVHL